MGTTGCSSVRLEYGLPLKLCYLPFFFFLLFFLCKTYRSKIPIPFFPFFPKSWLLTHPTPLPTFTHQPPPLHHHQRSPAAAMAILVPVATMSLLLVPTAPALRSPTMVAAVAQPTALPSSLSHLWVVTEVSPSSTWVLDCFVLVLVLWTILICWNYF